MKEGHVGVQCNPLTSNRICICRIIQNVSAVQHLRVLEVVAPQRPDLVLAADVPNRERDVLVLDRLDVKAWKGNDCHVTYLTDTAVQTKIIKYKKKP